jgi:hypothetical protein
MKRDTLSQEVGYALVYGFAPDIPSSAVARSVPRVATPLTVARATVSGTDSCRPLSKIADTGRDARARPRNRTTSLRTPPRWLESGSPCLEIRSPCGGRGHPASKSRRPAADRGHPGSNSVAWSRIGATERVWRSTSGDCERRAANSADRVPIDINPVCVGATRMRKAATLRRNSRTERAWRPPTLECAVT